MNFLISGIALTNGLKLKNGATTCTAKRKSKGQITIKLKKQSKLMRKIQLILFFALVSLALLPDTSKAPTTMVYELMLPITLFMIALRYLPNLHILNYHGAEHKVVMAYRKRLPLTLESVKSVSRVTKVCGTMLVVPIVFYVSLLSIAGILIQSRLLHILLTGLVFLSLVHYFFLRGEKVTYLYLNRLFPFLRKKPYKIKTNTLYKLFDKAGYFLQEHFTTREPSDDDLKVAILCMQKLIDAQRMKG